MSYGFLILRVKLKRQRPLDVFIGTSAAISSFINKSTNVQNFCNEESNALVFTVISAIVIYLFQVTPRPNPKSFPNVSRSMEKGFPAMAPDPKGDTSTS